MGRSLGAGGGPAAQSSCICLASGAGRTGCLTARLDWLAPRVINLEMLETGWPSAILMPPNGLGGL